MNLFIILLIGFAAFFYFVYFRSYYKGPQSGHFDGKRFRNDPARYRTVRQLLVWIATRKPVPWPEERFIGVPSKPGRRVEEEECVATFVNHSTVLIQWDGLNILTDPIWGEYAGPIKGLGPKRRHKPGIAFEDLPPIDLILLSHNHYDHMDLLTLKKLAQKFNPKIITGLGNRVYLDAHGIANVSELDWWQEIHPYPHIEVTYVPAQHFSARWPWDRNKALWGGFTVKSDTGILYFAGDSGPGSHFSEIRKRIGPPRLALLPIGAYEPRWFMREFHLSPEDAVQVHSDMQAKTSLAIHFGTFHLSDEGIDDPAQQLKRTLQGNKISEEAFCVLQPGESRHIS